jgi:hypothetical protein
MIASVGLAGTSTPSLTEFDPRAIPWQWQCLSDIRSNWNYSNGTVHEWLASGSVGSAKSILGAHLVATHCQFYPRARAVLGRQSMPDLKDTIIKKIEEHLEGDMIEGVDYERNRTNGSFLFSNGSEIISRSWADKKYKTAFRSVEASCGLIEELTENDESYKGFYPELRMRIGRLPHVPEAWLGSLTNPDSPMHWAYKYFIEPNLPGRSPHETRHVYYSLTEDNPFLPNGYIDGLKTSLDPKMAERMLKGRWLEIVTEVVYHQYSTERNYRDAEYKYDTGYPIILTFDFNIGVGKPLSAVSAQFKNDEFHFAETFIVEGADTNDILDEMAARGVLDHGVKYIIHGDASGKSRDTRSKTSDYEIMRKFFANYRTPKGQSIDFTILVPVQNPPLRLRHNTVNAYMHNAAKAVRLFVYRMAKDLDEGFRLTKLKQGGQYIEDDSFAFQHVTTAAGYAVIAQTIWAPRGSTSSTR